MDLKMLNKESSTSKVRILATELLSDGKVHTRREIVQYIREKQKQYNLEHFSDGCMSGGIHQAVNSLGCEKVGAAKYQIINTLPVVNAEDEPQESKKLTERAAQACEEFLKQLTVLSREIDYVNATQDEINQLDLMRECIKDTKLWSIKFKSYVQVFDL